jgi:hypothetical protein
MSTDLEQQLRGAMQHFTDDVRVPAGLAVKAFHHQRKRRVATRVAGGTAVLAAGALAAAGVTGAFGIGSARPAHASYTAYVVSHVEHALASPTQANSVEYTRTSYSPGTVIQPAGPFVMRLGHRPGSAWNVSSMQNWRYHDATHVAAFGPSGQPVFQMGGKVPAGAPGRSIGVSYVNRTWWLQSLVARPAPSGHAPIRCGPPIQMPVGITWSDYIRYQLGCGAYRVVGRQPVDGVNAIKIVSKQGQITFWVSPRSYLPVRMDLGLGNVGSQTDFRWLPPTPANLAHLKVTAPAGFTRVPPPWQGQAG